MKGVGFETVHFVRRYHKGCEMSTLVLVDFVLFFFSFSLVSAKQVPINLAVSYLLIFRFNNIL